MAYWRRVTLIHDDVIKWKHFPRNWPFVRGIHCLPVNSPQRPVTRSFDVSFICTLNKRLRKQSWGWWFEAPSRPLWRHCNFWPCNWLLTVKRLHAISRTELLPIYYVKKKSKWNLNKNTNNCFQDNVVPITLIFHFTLEFVCLHAVLKQKITENTLWVPTASFPLKPMCASEVNYGFQHIFVWWPKLIKR